MKIRDKILFYFSATVITLTALAFAIIYVLFSEYREEEFQKHQKEKVYYTVGLIADYQMMSERIASLLDRMTIHDFYDEKMLVFDAEKKRVFSSIDDLSIQGYQPILEELSEEKKWIETKEGDYDVVGMYLVRDGAGYFAISKAYDAFGYSKMFFLRNALIVIFFTIVIVVLIISVFLSEKITKPITQFAESLNNVDLSRESTQELVEASDTYEIQHLTERFNKLIQRTNVAFEFQKHAIQHISHELKTPIAILVTELERIRGINDINEIKTICEEQANKAKSLGEIIHVLLEISKIESGQEMSTESFRLDEVVFDIIDELHVLYPDFHFEINYQPHEFNEENLIVNSNKLLMRQALVNLLVNSVAYSSEKKSTVTFDCSNFHILKLSFSNIGKIINREEEKYIFNHFFRGKNSQGKTGFGLGLLLVKKIIVLNNGQIRYFNPSENLNVFEITLELS